jgi:hypothetical protein
MVAAAVLAARWVWDAAVMVAQWLAQKVFIVAVMAILLPWVLKGVFVWVFNWFAAYGRDIAQFITSQVSTQIANAGVAIDIQMTGVGGYIAEMTGLVDYASIIFTGWGLYWYVCILSKSARMIR